MVAATAVLAVVGSTPWSSLAFALAVAGFAPAALAMLRGPVPAGSVPEPARALA